MNTDTITTLTDFVVTFLFNLSTDRFVKKKNSLHWFVDVTQTLLASLNKSVSQSMGEAIKRKVNFEIKRAVIVNPCQNHWLWPL